VIHAISLAHFSLTSTRSWAINSWNARIRLMAENERLLQELALLQEEMRIKDSRMLRIPAQRRPFGVLQVGSSAPALVYRRLVTGPSNPEYFTVRPKTCFVLPMRLMFDGDNAGREGERACYRMLRTRVFLKSVHLTDGEQPDMLSEDRLRELLS